MRGKARLAKLRDSRESSRIHFASEIPNGEAKAYLESRLINGALTARREAGNTGNGNYLRYPLESAGNLKLRDCDKLEAGKGAASRAATPTRKRSRSSGVLRPEDEPLRSLRGSRIRASPGLDSPPTDFLLCKLALYGGGCAGDACLPILSARN
jgi:hypothetical protein